MLKFYTMKKYKPVSLKKLKTYPISKRKSKVEIALSVTPHKAGQSFKSFIANLPCILAAKDFGAVVMAIVTARKKKRPVILGMGAHPIKVGLSPVIIDLMNRGIITAIATNGACIIHDFELSFMGKTSEDVAAELCKGTFGMARETGELINKAINTGVKNGYGIGKSLGELIQNSRFKYKDMSVFGAAYRRGIPATVHIAIGTDIIHMHPQA
ncbi:MAG: hypothetical protein Q8M34_09630, partial [Thermodesulfovibrionales bacterium]|nr:hypothetical protein [Thermodesulfovibrionales bacterium]